MLRSIKIKFLAHAEYFHVLESHHWNSVGSNRLYIIINITCNIKIMFILVAHRPVGPPGPLWFRVWVSWAVEGVPVFSVGLILGPAGIQGKCFFGELIRASRSVQYLLRPGKAWRREWPCTPVFLPGGFHGQRSLMGCRSWGCKELDMTRVT